MEFGLWSPLMGSPLSLPEVLPLLLVPANVGTAPAKASSCLTEAARPSVMTADESAQPSHRGIGPCQRPGLLRSGFQQIFGFCKHLLSTSYVRHFPRMSFPFLKNNNNTISCDSGDFFELHDYLEKGGFDITYIRWFLKCMECDNPVLS